jgi:hypothetical protein
MGTQASQSQGELTLNVDDGNAGCLMGAVLALVLMFGLLMGAVTLYFITAQGKGEASDWDPIAPP